MDAAAFTESAWGRLTRTAQGNPAFVPDPAPRRLSLSSEAIDLLDEASGRLGLLRGIARALPTPDLLVGPYLRREAVLSSRIEGTQTTVEEVFAAEAEQLSLIGSPDVQEVRNYVDAYQYGLQRLATLPLSLRLIRELHGRLTSRGRGQSPRLGEFRRYQNFIGGSSEATATYVPPPVPEMAAALDEFERFMHDRTLRPLVQVALLHYQFEAIHPFGDGNGRVGRLLMGLFLAERDLMPRPLLHLSPYFERTRAEYYRGLMRVSTHGDWDAWIRYVLEGVRVQADEATELADGLRELQTRYRAALHGRRTTTTALALVDSLFVNPLVTTRRVQELFGVSAPTARATIGALEEAGVLREISGRKWGRIYRADEILDLVREERGSGSGG